MNSANARIIVASNRLPITVENDARRTRIRPSSGGLVTALRSALVGESAQWVGWMGPNAASDAAKAIQSSHDFPFGMVPVTLTEEQVSKFYFGFSNEIIWPLFHDLQSRCNFDPTYWSSYLEVNKVYSDTIAPLVQPSDLVWVHDYHLAIVGKQLRQAGVHNRIGYFQHIPFPSPDIFFKLPWRREFLDAMLAYDVVGFQTPRDLRNFLHCARSVLKRKITISREGRSMVIHGDHRTSALALPIGIDFAEFSEGAATDRVRRMCEEIRRAHLGRRLLLGVDRLDYTKGIPERLKAYERMLDVHPEWRGRAVLVQIVVPSREDIPRYRDLKLEIEHLVARINGRFTDRAWVPIHFVYRHVDRPQLLAHYRSADVGVVTPLKDGMNLVAKEYCAAQVEDSGVLVLSEFAGASRQMGSSALLVNPYDIEATAETLHTALRMHEDESRRRMTQLRTQVHDANVYRWTSDFISALLNRSVAASATARMHRNSGYSVLSNSA